MFSTLQDRTLVDHTALQICVKLGLLRIVGGVEGVRVTEGEGRGRGVFIYCLP